MANNNKDVKRGIVLYLDGKAVEANAQNIQREMRKVKKEIDQCTFGSKEYVAATKRYKELNNILQDHKNKLRDVKQEHFSFVNTINGLWQKWNVTIGAFMATFAGVSLALSKFRKEMNATEESSANLKALTGLDDTSISWLQEQAEKLSTTMDESGLRIQQSAKDILEAYMLVGSAKPELLSDKEALNSVTIEAMRLSSAAKMDLKAAVDAVTLSLNQYGEQADQASRYVNVLAAGSKFGAAGVESQTTAIIKAGVAASTAKVPIETLVGSIETLAEKGIKGEVAGTGLKTFFLKLEGMADDVRPSVVGLETALDNLRKKNLSTAETQKMFGLEAFTVAQAMIQGADKVREYTQAVTDTNVATEQAAINSDTANAKMAQMRNEFSLQGQILVKELNPAITKMLSLGMNSTRILVQLLRLITQYRTTLSLATIAITAYVAWVNRKVIIDKLAVFWSDKAALSMTKLNAVIRANPWGAAITALTIVVGLVADYNRKLENSVKQSTILDSVNKTASKQFAEEAGHIDRLNKQLHSANLSYDDRKKALDELKRIVPGYHADLTTEGKLINDNTDAIKEYLASLETQIKLKAAQEELEQKYRDKRQQEKDLEKKQAIEDEKRKAQISASLAASMAGSGNNSGYAAVGKASSSSVNGVQKANNELKKAVKERQAIADELEMTNKDIDALNAEIENSSISVASTGSAGGNTDGGSGGGSGSSSKTTKTTDRIKEETALIEAEITRRQNIIKQMYAQGKIDRQQYNQDMEDLEILRIQKMLQIAGLEPEKVAELQAKIQDIAVKAREALESLEIKTYKDNSYEDYVARAEQLRKKQKEQLATLKQNLNLKNITTKQYNEEARRIDEQYFKDSTSLWSEYYSNLNKTIAEGNQEMTETQKKQAKIFQDTVQPIMESLGNALGDALAGAISGKQEDVHDSMLSLLQEIISAIQKMAIAYIAERTITNVGTLGVWGLAKAAGEIALITAAGATLNGLIERGKNSYKSNNGYATGGYTGTGGAFEPAGTVHKNEFVANRFAVANPAVKSVLDVIDQAQRSGSVANLTSADLSSVGAPSASTTQSTTSDIALASMVSVIKDCTKMLASVKSRFDEPIVAETFLTGNGGINKAKELETKIKNNAYRK